MNLSLFQIVSASLMVGVVFTLIVVFRKYQNAASERRMLSMLECVGLDPAIARSASTEELMKQIRKRCRTCSTEDVCERWLNGGEDGYNAFCPNALEFNRLKLHYKPRVGP